MVSVATRVFLGHNERHDLLASPMRWFHFVWGLTLFTAATRLTSEFVMKVRITHFTYAAILWVVILAFWWWKLHRDLRKPRLRRRHHQNELPPPPQSRRPRACREVSRSCCVSQQAVQGASRPRLFIFLMRSQRAERTDATHLIHPCHRCASAEPEIHGFDHRKSGRHRGDGVGIWGRRASRTSCWRWVIQDR